MVGGNRATTCLICPKDFRMSYTSSSIRPPPTLSDPVLSSRNRKDLALERQHFHQLYRPQGPLERKRSPARPPLSGRPGQGLAWSPRFVTGQSPVASSPGRPAAPRGRSLPGARPAGNAAPPPCWRQPPRRTAAAAAAAPAPRVLGPAASRPPGEDAESREEGGRRSPGLAALLRGRPQRGRRCQWGAGGGGSSSGGSRAPTVPARSPATTALRRPARPNLIWPRGRGRDRSCVLVADWAMLPRRRALVQSLLPEPAGKRAAGAVRPPRAPSPFPPYPWEYNPNSRALCLFLSVLVLAGNSLTTPCIPPGLHL